MQKQTHLLYRGNGVDDHDNRDMECYKSKMPLGCELLYRDSGSGSHTSSLSGSAKDRGPPSAGKRKILRKQGGAPKKQKGSIVKSTSNLKHTAAGGANLPPSQRYTFYRNFGIYSVTFLDYCILINRENAANFLYCNFRLEFTRQ